MYIFIMSLCGVAILITMYKTHKFFRSLFLSALQGTVALFAVNFIGEFIGLHIALNSFSLLVGTLGGLPGIIFLLVSDIMCAI